ncbi:Nucleocapsid [Penicillium discovirus]|uniref:Nucleocapsid n=1 Tax=Penicillium discovirus TaxID=2185132 RepID=A0A4Y1LTA6_9VIRU|nr:Nucleocapsid [Penicillium discovirus]AWN00473.1 Nucleocapsid [Penicillium discovirus]
MSQSSQPFAPGPSGSRNAPGVPSAQGGDMRSNIGPPTLVGGRFDELMTGGDAQSLHHLITQYMSQFDATTFIQNIKYQGFNRDEFIREALMRITPSQMLRAALIGAIRGATIEKIIKSLPLLMQIYFQLAGQGVIQRTAKRSGDITILRCTSAIPQWCAFYMGKAGVVKKVPASECPSWAQFPAAASLPMSQQLRHSHVRFSIAFSKVIGGSFNENIYMAMFNNQLDMSEIPDELKAQLGINSREESLAVDVATIIASEINQRGR